MAVKQKLAQQMLQCLRRLRQLPKCKRKDPGRGRMRTGIASTLVSWPWVRFFFELVVSDLDSQFIGACRSLLHPMLRDSGGVRLRHEPLQRAIADSLREPDVHTFVVFGSYGTFPDPDHRALMTWLSKVFIAPFFPNSWSSFARQCPSSADDEDLPWMDRKGQVWMAEPEIQDGLTLVACAAYPRDQQPTEAEAAARRYEAALALIASTAGMPGRPGQKTVATPPKRIRVITHAMGSFVGHDDVSIFAQGLAEGVRRFLSSLGQAHNPSCFLHFETDV